MISPVIEKKLLQTVVALACVVPLSAGLCGALKGVQFLGDGNIDLDSHFRYLSGLLLGIGIGFLCLIPNIERHTGFIRLLTLIVIVGGGSRLLGFFLAGIPDHDMQTALIMELVVAPAICLWQHRVARRFTS